MSLYQEIKEELERLDTEYSQGEEKIELLKQEMSNIAVMLIKIEGAQLVLRGILSNLDTELYVKKETADISGYPVK